MVIQTFDKGYIVLSILEQNEKSDVFLCADNLDGKRYVIFRWKDTAAIAAIIKYISDQVQRKDFYDVIECFSYDKEFHVVFQYYEGENLSDKLKQENVSFEERLEIGRNMFERMLLLNMPYYFQSICFNKNNVCVTRSLEVNFQYSFWDMEHFNTYSMKQVSQAAAEIVSFLFEKELKKESVDPIQELVIRLKEEEWTDYMEIYTSYQEVCAEVEQLSETERKTPKTWEFRLWDKAKCLWKPVKRAIMFLILVGVFAYMVYIIHQSLQPKPDQKSFDYIGTVEIK
ncbi:hypothetical protein [Anaeromicropila populeti]|uniref:Serine/threonine protein kinase n=1 Tax=Anaeromicropila populeti TaxID=37658 RepID=A0A1I6LTT8_9FIRM|nr:hypothetical protein [Anaeromicropila populeti]SFS06873.1 hypothetical protein SAMN05661086_03559 [Anaeromicropila populeti]